METKERPGGGGGGVGGWGGMGYPFPKKLDDKRTLLSTAVLRFVFLPRLFSGF